MKNLPAFGLDIGTSSIKAVWLGKEKDRYVLVAAGKIASPVGILQSESESDWQIAATAINELLTESKITSRQVCSCLPESEVITRVLELPMMSDTEIATSMRYQIEQNIPFQSDEIYSEWKILEKPEKNEKNQSLKILLVAVHKPVEDRHLKILEMAGLEPRAVETELISLCRSLVNPQEPSPITLVVNLSSETTDLAVVKNNVLVFTRSVGTGGNALSRAVSSALGIESSQAEEYKKVYGLDETKMEGKITKAIRPIVDIIKDEIKRAILAYQNKNPEDGIKRTVLCGGMARLPGLSELLAEEINTEVQLGDPWQNLIVTSEQKKSFAEEGPVYTAAVGLAMRGDEQ